MSDLPVWLLDIDGVVNAATKNPPTHAWPAEDWINGVATNAGKTWRILSARPVADFIRTVHEQGRAEIRWHTTWQDDAHQVSAMLDLPTFAVQAAPEFHRVEEHLRRDEWWKLPAVMRVLAEEKRRVVWSDDDTAWDLSVSQRTALGQAGPLLLIAPDPYTGLCRKHLRQIDAFLGRAS